MANPEVPSPESLTPIEPETWEHLGGRLENKARLARIMGIRMHYTVTDLANPGHRHTRRAHEAFYGASLGKAIIPKMAQDMGLSEEEVIEWEPNPNQTTPSGGGHFDKVGVTPRASVGELVTDMMGPGSGNKAFTVLARRLGGAGAINAYLIDNDYEQTWVKDSGTGGTFLGETSPLEMDDIFGTLTADTSTEGIIFTARQALLDRRFPKDQNSILKYISPDSNIVAAYIKSADYPGDSDKNYRVPYAVENEMGELHMANDQRIRYVIQTKGPRHDGAYKPLGALPNWVEKNLLRQTTAEIAYAAQGRPVIELGHRARRWT